MLYSEFVEGTGCKQNEKNYEIYKNLEIMYMNSDMTKQEIYEYGKKLVDNSKTAEQIELEKKIAEEIDEHKRVIESYKTEINSYESLLSFEEDPLWIKNWKSQIKWRKEIIRSERNRIAELKWILE